jgi:hypothetical protein
VVNPNTGIEYIDQFGSDLEALIDSTTFADAADTFIPHQMAENPSLGMTE